MLSSIPAPLAAYIADCLAPNSLTLVTSVLSTPSPWLCLRLLHAALYGVEDEEQTGQYDVVFLSLLRPLSLWAEMGRKTGLDIPALLKSRRLRYIDALAGGMPSSTGPAGTEVDGHQLPTTTLSRLTLMDLKDALEAASRTSSISTSTTTTTTPTASAPLSPRGTPTPRVPTGAARPAATTATTTNTSSSSVAGKPVVVIDGIDFLLASQPSVSTVELQSFLAALRTKCHALVLTYQADSPLLHGPAVTPSLDAGLPTPTPLERNHVHLLISLAHLARWLFQLRGLDTGSAKDVSGVVRVSRGGDVGIDAGLDGRQERQQRVQVQDLVDGEWLYQLKGDGSVRVWARGE